MRLALALAVVALAPTASALVSDYWILDGDATDVAVTVAPQGVTACHAEGGTGEGVVEREWSYYYSFHFVVETDCGAFPLDFYAKWTARSSERGDHFVVTGTWETPTATGECWADRQWPETFSCTVTQGGVVFEGDFVGKLIIF